jgi:hypothetical protein
MVLALTADLDRIKPSHKAVSSDSHPLAERDTVGSDGTVDDRYVLPLPQRSEHVATVPTPVDSLFAAYLASVTAGKIFAACASDNPADQERDDQGRVRLYHEMALKLHARKFKSGPNANKSIFAYNRAKAMHEEKFEAGPHEGKSVAAYNMGKVMHEQKYETGPHEGKSKYAVFIGTLSHAEKYTDGPSEGKSITTVEKGRLSMAQKIENGADAGKAQHAVDMATAAHAERDDAGKSLLGIANGQRSMKARIATGKDAGKAAHAVAMAAKANAEKVADGVHAGKSKNALAGALKLHSKKNAEGKSAIASASMTNRWASLSKEERTAVQKAKYAKTDENGNSVYAQKVGEGSRRAHLAKATKRRQDALQDLAKMQRVKDLVQARADRRSMNRNELDVFCTSVGLQGGWKNQIATVHGWAAAESYALQQTWIQDIRSEEYIALVLPIMHVSGLLRGKTTDQVAGQLALKSSVRSHLFRLLRLTTL